MLGSNSTVIRLILETLLFLCVVKLQRRKSDVKEFRVSSFIISTLDLQRINKVKTSFGNTFIFRLELVCDNIMESYYILLLVIVFNISNLIFENIGLSEEKTTSDQYSKKLNVKSFFKNVDFQKFSPVF